MKKFVDESKRVRFLGQVNADNRGWEAGKGRYNRKSNCVNVKYYLLLSKDKP